MKKRILLLIIFLIFQSMVFSAAALDDKTPSLKIVYQRDKDSVNPGEQIKFDIYFPGDGNISLCRCSIYYNGQFYDDIKYSTTGSEMQSFNLNKGVVNSLLIPTDLFLTSRDEYWAPPQLETGGRVGGSEPLVAPLSIWLDTKSDISEGDHYIVLFLAYTDGNSWYTSEKNLDFRVKTVSETYGLIINVVLPISLAIVSILVGIFVGKKVYSKPRLKIKSNTKVTRRQDNIIVEVKGTIKNNGNMDLNNLSGTIFATLGGNIPGPVNIAFLPEGNEQINLYPKFKKDFTATQTFIAGDIDDSVTQGKVSIKFKNDVFEKSKEMIFNI